MKTQIFTYIKYTGMLLCSALLLSSCSKEDGPGNEPDPTEKSELVLTASATEIDKGDAVTFEVTSEGKAIDADIYIDNTKINGTSHTFEDVGIHQVVAKKDGYTDSEIIEIKSYQVDVYVAGSKIVNNRPVAIYWKNGVPITLSDDPFRDERAYSIVVDNGDVHVVGAVVSTGYPIIAKYWINGKSIDLDNGTGAISVFVDKGDVYIAGSRRQDDSPFPVAKYWKNGVSVDLSDGSQIETATAITVDNGDVYVAGTTNMGSTRFAKYWENGTAVVLTDGTESAFTNGIAVDDGSVYVSGYEDAAPKYWKDGTPVMLNDGRYSVYTSSMFVDNGDIYVSGFGHESGFYADVAKYWKNGTPVILSDGKLRTSTSSIFVSNGDVYVLGEEGGTPIYWKNGTPVKLETGGATSSARSIFVVRSFEKE